MTELKTLKDMGVIEECNKKNACEWHVHKNGETIDYDFKSVDIEELKQEAIKWVKSFYNAKGNLSEKYGDSKVIGFIKHFFNLTEEDLK